MNHNTQELLKLIKENPDLPILPTVNYEVCSGDFNYWMASFSRCHIDEFIIDDWYGDGCVRFKSDGDEDIIIEGLAEHKDGDCTNEYNWKKAEEYLKTLWKKAIIVYIELPDCLE